MVALSLLMQVLILALCIVFVQIIIHPFYRNNSFVADERMATPVGLSAGSGKADMTL